MQDDVMSYLEEVRQHLHLEAAVERRVLTEMYAHFQERISELRERGIPEPEAIREAIRAFGSARGVARLMYEAYGRGSWIEAFLGSWPHLMAAVLFATHGWRRPVPLACAAGAILGIALWAGRRGRPGWLASWTGYSLFFLLVPLYGGRAAVAQAVAFLGGIAGAPAPAWLSLASTAACMVLLWVLLTAAVRAARRDWVPAASMLAPLPVLGIWVVSVDPTGASLAAVFRLIGEELSRWDSPMTLLCLAGAAATVFAVRLRSRTGKVLSVFGMGMAGGAAVLATVRGDTTLPTLALGSLIALLFLAVPAFLGLLPARGGAWDRAGDPYPV